MKSRLICLSLILLVFLPALVFSMGQTGTTTTAQLTKIKGVFDIILTKESGSDRWAEEFKKLTGVEIEIVKPPHSQYVDILSATFASGDLPDICEIQTNDYLAYASSGKLVAMDDAIKKADFMKSVPSQFVEAYRLKDGHVYAIPLNRGGGCVMFIRKDWLDKLGMKVPANYNEFYEVLKAFVNKDPDGNGQKDTIGMTLPFSVSPLEFDYYNRFIMQGAMFGFVVKGGKWRDGFTEPEMKGALERFVKLYKEGLIDTEFFSNKTSTARSKIYEGQAGMMEYWSGTWAKTFYDSAKNANPKAEVIPIAPIKEATYLNRVGVALSITTAAKNPAEVFRVFFGTMLDKGAGQMLFTYGVEGLHYKKAGTGIEMLPAPDNPDRTFDKSYVHPELTLNDWKLPLALEENIALSREIHVKYSDQLYLPQGGSVYLKSIGELMTLKQEIFSKIVVGDVSVDAGLAEYKQKAAGLQIDALMAELNS